MWPSQFKITNKANRYSLKYLCSLLVNTFHFVKIYFENDNDRWFIIHDYYLQGISAKTKCLIESDDKEFFVSTSFKVEIQKEHFSLKWTSSFLLCSFDIKRRSRLKHVYLVNKDNDNSKTGDLPENSALKIHYPELDARETSQKMEKMAVCVKPFHLQFNRALWVSIVQM